MQQNTYFVSKRELERYSIEASCKRGKTAGDRGSRHQRSEHTFQWRKASIHNQLQVAKLPLGEDNGWELLSLIVELLATRRIACDEVLQDTA